MHKKYILQCLNFQLKHYYQLIFNLLRHNLKPKQIKQSTLNHLKSLIPSYKKHKSLQFKQRTFSNYFLRHILLSRFFPAFKTQIHSLHLIHLLNNQKEELFTIKQTIFTYNSFFNILHKQLFIHKTQLHFNMKFIKRTYITFFKNICELRSNKSIYNKKINDIETYYLYNLARKTLHILQHNAITSIEHRSIYSRKYLIKKQFFNKLKSLYYKSKEITYYYRTLHLKRYYFNRLIRTIRLIQMNQIARQKFIMKWLYIWKKAVYINKQLKTKSVVHLWKCMNDMNMFYIHYFKSFFMKCLKRINVYILQNQIYEIKLLQYHKKINTLRKRNVLYMLKYNRIINKCLNKKNFLIIKNTFDVLKFMKNISTPIVVRNEIADECYKKMLCKKIKKCLLYLKDKVRFDFKRAKLIRMFLLKKKIFRLLLKFTVQSKKSNKIIIQRFRKYMMYYEVFNVLKMNMLIAYRENKIIKGVQKILKKKRKKFLNVLWTCLINNVKVERFKRIRNMKLVVKVFTALKMMT